MTDITVASAPFVPPPTLPYAYAPGYTITAYRPPDGISALMGNVKNGLCWQVAVTTPTGDLVIWAESPEALYQEVWRLPKDQETS